MTHRIHGRRRPYTLRGIRRLPCVRCGQRASATWHICADGNLARPLCTDCDIALNAMVLEWSGLPGWQEKAAAYEAEKRA